MQMQGVFDVPDLLPLLQNAEACIRAAGVSDDSVTCRRIPCVRVHAHWPLRKGKIKPPAIMYMDDYFLEVDRRIRHLLA